MTRHDDNLKQLLDAAIAGQLDELTDEQIAQLAEHLDASPNDAARLAAVAPPVSALVAPPLVQPSAAEWSRIWRGIDKATGEREVVVRRLRVWRGVQSFAAIAACVLVALVWRGGRVATSGGGALESATGVQIDEMVVAGGYSATVDVSDDGSAIIWLSETDADEGA